VRWGSGDSGDSGGGDDGLGDGSGVSGVIGGGGSAGGPKGEDVEAEAAARVGVGGGLGHAARSLPRGRARGCWCLLLRLRAVRVVAVLLLLLRGRSGGARGAAPVVLQCGRRVQRRGRRADLADRQHVSWAVFLRCFGRVAPCGEGRGGVGGVVARSCSCSRARG